VNTAGEPPLRPPVERRAASTVAWIAATLLVVVALVFAWEPPPNPDVAAATAMPLPSLPSLPDPAAPASVLAREDADAGLATTGASGTELIEVCGVGWVPPDASGAVDRGAVAGDRDVLASQRTLLAAMRRDDGEVGDAMATVLGLQGAGRDNPSGTPLQALLHCSASSAVPASSASSGLPACAGRDEDRQRAATLVEHLAKLASATREPRVYALAMQQCQSAKGQGSCALLNLDQWARVDDGNGLPWLHILERARVRNDRAQIDEALHHIGAAARFEGATYAIAGRVADHAGAGDVDGIAALLVAVDAVHIAARIEPYDALNTVCKGASLSDANRRQECEHAAQTLAERSDLPLAVLNGAELGRRLGWPTERVDALRRLASSNSAMDEGQAKTLVLGELPSSCASARRVLASFSRRGRDGEVQTVRTWLEAQGASTAGLARVLPPAAAASADQTATADAVAVPAAADVASVAATAAAAALPAPPSSASSATPAASPPEGAASATPYSAIPPPDR